MALSKDGIDALERVMLQNAKRYNQGVYGALASCGTTMCAAGFARLLKVGEERFKAEVLSVDAEYDEFCNACLEDGAGLLGLVLKPAFAGTIFDLPSSWPTDLGSAFWEAKDQKARVCVYIDMLRSGRVRDDGTIAEAAQ